MRELIISSKAYRMLAGDRAADRLSHAYFLLFEDERFLRFALKELALVILGDDERSRRLIEKESYADCIFLPEAGGKLTAESATRIAETCIERPVEGDKKLYVLDNMQNANVAAQNKLLKVLEEPPEGVYFLLGTTNPGTALPTVLSRTKQLVVPRFTEAEVLACLKRTFPNAGEDALVEAAAVAGGVCGKAFAALEEGTYGEMLALALRMASSPECEIPSLVRAAAKYPDKAGFLSALKLVFYEMLRIKRERNILLAPFAAKLTAAAEGYSAASLIAAVEHVAKAEMQVTFFANYPQALELLLAKIAKEKERWSKLSV